MNREPTLFMYSIKAIFLMKKFGMQVACDYLKTRGVTVEEAASILALKGN